MTATPASRCRALRWLGVCLALSALSLPAQPTVSNVRATPRTGTKLVDITYDLAHAAGLSCMVKVEVSQDGGSTYATVASLTGAVGGGITPGTNKAVVWNAGQDWSAALFNNVRVRVTADDGQSSGGGGPAPAGMVPIPAGTFTMGDSKNEGRSNERPTRSVTLSAFYLQTTEVTYAQWKEIVDWNTSGSRGYDFAAGQRGSTSGLSALADTAANNSHPVTQVSWWDVSKWCNAKSRKEGLTPCYYTDAGFTAELKTGTPSTVVCNWSANGYRLPTEAEWEYAARGGLAGKSYPWGDTITGSQANFRESGDPFGGTTPVGYYNGSQTPAGSDMKNGYGLYDMAGNVWEWCWDWLGTYPATAETNPRGPASGSYRVVRGGSWYYSFTSNLRCAIRAGETPGFRDSGISLGFRPARNSVP